MFFGRAVCVYTPVTRSFVDNQKISCLLQEYQDHMNELQKALLEKTKEANRLRDSFNTIRSTHEDLRKQVNFKIIVEKSL